MPILYNNNKMVDVDKKKEETMAAFKCHGNIKNIVVKTKLKNPLPLVALRLVLTPDVCYENKTLMQTTFLALALAILTNFN